MNPILKLVQQVKDAEGVTLASVIKKVEDIRIGENQNKTDLKKLAVALVALKKQVDSIPLTEEVKKLQRAILDAEERVSGALSARIDSVEKDLRATEERLLAEIDIKIPDIVTVTEKVTEVAKELTEEEQNKIMARIFSEEGAKQVRDMLEGLEGDDRLDAKAIKNLPSTIISNGGGGSNLSVFSNGTFVSSSTRLNFVGATVTDEGGRTKVTITGGSGSSTFLDLTDTPSSYSGQAGKVAAVNGTEDGIEFIEVAGTGTVTSVAISGSDGIEVDSGSPITAAGTIALGLNKTTTLTFLNVEDGAEVNTIDTVADTAEIDLTVSARQLTASIVAGSIDESKLDASVNASLDKADSASQPGHTHAASDVTSGTFDNARIAQSNVTQHQAALSITESQISDLKNYQIKAVANGSLTAANDTFYVCVSTSTFTDPSPVEGEGFAVFVRNGTATVGGTGYSTAGTIIHRIFHSGSWANYSFSTDATIAAAYQPLDADLTTIAGLVDPNADRILFWDDSAGSYAYLTASTGLTISGTSMTVRTSSSTQTGIVELATDAETVTGTDTSRATTPANITARLAAPGTIGGTTPGAATFTTVTTTGNIELGNASDTTISRDAAGQIAVEGVRIPTISSTNTLTNKTLSAPVLTGTTDAERIDYDRAIGTVSALGNLGATETVNWSTATNFTGTLDQNITIDFSNAVSGQTIVLYLAYDGTAQRTIAWTPTIEWGGGTAPTGPDESGEYLVVTLKYIGTTYFGSFELFK